MDFQPFLAQFQPGSINGERQGKNNIKLLKNEKNYVDR
jgi:hypothetical protein